MMRKFFALTCALVCYALMPSLYACSVCFGEQGTRQSNALGWAVGFLLLTVGIVLAGIAGVALRWMLRAKKISSQSR